MVLKKFFVQITKSLEGAISRLNLNGSASLTDRFVNRTEEVTVGGVAEKKVPSFGDSCGEKLKYM